MRFIFVFLISLFLLETVWSDEQTTVTMELYNTVYQGLDDWYFLGSGRARVDFDSQGNRDVKAELELDFYPSVTDPFISSFFIKRASIKANVESLRVTLGKTRVSWGPSNSVIFNSGDVLFGSRNPFVDFSQTDLRSETAWLTSFYYPIGILSFVEAIVLPPSSLVDCEPSTSFEDCESPTASLASGGVRAKFSIGNWWLEGGVYYKGENQTVDDDLGIRPYFSFEGNVGPDIYGAVSLAYDPQEKFTTSPVEETVNLSFGVLQRITQNNGSWSFRLESLIQPWQEWTAQDINSLGAEDKTYGILLYPEITYNYGTSYVYGVQGIVSPVDNSGTVSVSFGWYIYQGLYWVNYASLNWGSADDLFAWDRSSNWPTGSSGDLTNGKVFTTGLRYVY